MGATGRKRTRRRTRPERAALAAALVLPLLAAPSAIDAARPQPVVRLAHRLAAIRELTPRGAHYLGTGRDGVPHFRGGWTTGFVPGAEWRVAAATRSGRLARRALADTLRLAGHEGDDDHDRGFVYERSAGAGLDLACTRGAPFGAGASACGRMRRMVVRSAAQLRRMAGRNPAGAVPTSYSRCRTCRRGELDVIVDSLENVLVLVHAAELTGQDAFREIALRHARWVARHHLRADGSTVQSVHIDRASGDVLRTETHQGIRGGSTWARGQAWAIHGFANLAARLDDPRLLDAARSAADYWISRDPAGALPRYDFDAPPGAPLDSTAAAAATAGFADLARACGEACDGSRYRAYAARLRRSVISTIGSNGRLDRGAYIVRAGDPTWDDRAELAFGLDYTAEALTDQPRLP